MTRSVAAGIGMLLVIMLGCGGSHEPSPVPATILIVPALDSIVQGDTVQFIAVGRTADGQEFPIEVDWHSTDPVGVPIDSSGRAIAIRRVTAGISASAKGVVGNRIVRVIPTPAELRVFPEHAGFVGSGTYQLLAVVRDSFGRTLPGRVIRWTISDSAHLAPAGTGDSPQSLVVVTSAPGTFVATAETHGRRVADTITVGQVTFDSIWVRTGRACAVTTDGRPFCWGSGIANRLGSGMQVDALFPQAVSGGYRFASMAMDDVVGCGLTPVGDAFCWGADTGYAVAYPFPVDSIPRGTGPGHHWRTLYTAGLGGYGSTLCGLEQTTAYCWGQNGLGQLGVGDLGIRSTPTPVSGGLAFASLALGRYAACGVTVAGKLYCWGVPAFLGPDPVPYGRCGLGLACLPVPLQDSVTFATVVAESESFCALDSNQRPWCWGYQAGYGPPTQTVALQLLQVSTGDTHSCGLLPNHAAVCWGDNSMGALGEGTRTSSPVPVPVASGLTFRQIAVGENSTCAITLSGTAYCWGQNDAGQVGDGTRIMRLVPTRVLGQP